MSMRKLLTGAVAAVALLANAQLSHAAAPAALAGAGLLAIESIDEAPQWIAPLDTAKRNKSAKSVGVAKPAPALASLARLTPIADMAAVELNALETRDLEARDLQGVVEIVALEADAAPGGEENAVFDTAEVVGLDDLSTMIGATGLPLNVLTDQTLTAVNRGNQINANQVGSGQITLDQNAFTGFSGIGNFVINSGHNNNLQSSLSVNIVITQ